MYVDLSMSTEMLLRHVPFLRNMKSFNGLADRCKFLNDAVMPGGRTTPRHTDVGLLPFERLGLMTLLMPLVSLLVLHDVYLKMVRILRILFSNTYSIFSFCLEVFIVMIMNFNRLYLLDSKIQPRARRPVKPPHSWVPLLYSLPSCLVSIYTVMAALFEYYELKLFLPVLLLVGEYFLLLNLHSSIRPQSEIDEPYIKRNQWRKEDFTNPKDYARSKKAMRDSNQRKDDDRRKYYRKAQLIRINNKLRQAGRHVKADEDDITPEGHFNYGRYMERESKISEIKRTAMRINSRVQPQGWFMRDGVKDAQSIGSSLEDLSSILSNDDSHTKLASLMVKFSGFLLGLSTCSTPDDLMKTVVALLSQHVTEEHIDFISKLVMDPSTDGVNFDLSEVDDTIPHANLQDLKESLMRFKSFSLGIEELPLYQVIRKVMAVIVYFGLEPSKQLDECKFKDFLVGFEGQVGEEFGKLGSMESFLYVVEFGIDFIEVAQAGGDMKVLLLPNALYSRYADILGNRTKFLQGTLEAELKISNGAYYDQIVCLKADLDRCLASKKLTPQSRAQYVAYYIKIKELESDVLAARRSFELRRAPLGVVFYGGSGVGKTGIMTGLCELWGAATGMACAPENQYWKNESDQYMSGYNYKHTIILMDDLSNTKIDGNNPSTSDLSMFVRFGNNAPYSTNQASLENKGVIHCLSDLLVCSTNVQDVKVHEVSNEPYSVTRRFIFVEIRVKPEFRKPGSGGLDGSKVPIIDGIQEPAHDVRIYYYEPYMKNGDVVPGKMRGPYYRPYNGDEAGWMPISVFYEWFGREAKEHIDGQREYLKMMKLRREKKRCPNCHQPEGSSWCCRSDEPFNLTRATADLQEEHLPPPVPQVARKHPAFTYRRSADAKNRQRNTHVKARPTPPAEVDPEFRDIISNLSRSFCGDMVATLSTMQFFQMNTQLDMYFTRMVIGLVALLLKQWRIFIPSSRWTIFFSGPALLALYHLALHYGHMFFVVQLYMKAGWFGVGLFVAIVLFLTYVFLCGFGKYVRLALSAEITERATMRLGKIEIATIFATLYVSVTSIRKMMTMYNSYNSTPQGNLAPKSMEEVKVRMTESSDWTKYQRMKLPVKDQTVSTSTMEQIQSRVTRNLVRVVFDTGKVSMFGKSKMFNGQGMMLGNKVILLPYHSSMDMLKYSDYPDVEIQDIPGNHTSFFKSKLMNGVRLEQDGKPMDYMAFQLERPSEKQLLAGFFVEVDPLPTAAEMVTLEADGSITNRSLMFTPGEVTNNATDEKGKIYSLGSKHKLQIATKNGDCMSPIFSMTKPHQIIGLHSGGGSGGQAVAFTIRADTIRNAIAKFPNGIEPHGPGIFIPNGEVTDGFENVSPLGNPIFAPTENHKRDCINYVHKAERVPALKNYGHDNASMVTPRTCIKNTFLCPALEALGVKTIFSPPKIHSGKIHQKYFQLAIYPMKNICPATLRLAIIDYYVGVRDVLKEIKYEKLRPQTLDEAFNGVKGRRFQKEMDECTSAGPGLKGQKASHVEITFDPVTGKKHLAPLDYVVQGVADIMAKLERGVMAMPLVKSCIKDEPTAIVGPGEEQKIRIFSVYPMCFFIAGKMLFAPILEALYAIPFTAEMMQGTNVTTDDWNQIHDHIFEKDRSRRMVLEGDYSKYDTRLSGQLIRAAGSVMIQVARDLGYEEKHLTAMSAYIEDLAYTIWTFNGCVFAMDGWNTSGNYLTIAINGIANSLIHRCAFYEIAQSKGKEPVGPSAFRDIVRLATVGDDSLGTTTESWFNMTSMQEWCASMDLKYTDAHKNAVAIPFTTPEDATLCKRKFRLEETLGMYVAPLAIESILKSIQCCRESVTDEVTIVVNNVSAAFGELVNHGEEIYDKYYLLIKNACLSVEIWHMVPKSELTYAERLKAANARYTQNLQLDSSEEEDQTDLLGHLDDDIMSFSNNSEDTEFGCIIPEK